MSRTAVPCIRGVGARGAMVPRPNMAVRLVITATRLLRTVRVEACAASSTMASQAAATPGE